MNVLCVAGEVVPSCKENITINAKCLRARSTSRTFLKWRLTLIREYNEVGKRFFFVRVCVRTMEECRAASDSMSDCEIHQNKRQHWLYASASMIYLHSHKARTLRSASPYVYKTNRCCLRRCFKKQLKRRSTGTEHTSAFLSLLRNRNSLKYNSNSIQHHSKNKLKPWFKTISVFRQNSCVS